MVLIFRFDRLISQLEQMGLRGEKIEDKALEEVVSLFEKLFLK